MFDHQLAQLELCKKYGVHCTLPGPYQKVGVALNVRSGLQPINGLRHPPVGDTSGWYIWAGEHLSADPGFFKPLHICHLNEWCPGALRFLGLPPGYRFLFSTDYEDVWKDDALLVT